MVTTDLLCRRVASACSWHIICYCTPQYNFLGKQTCQCTQLFLLSVNTYVGFSPNVLCGGKRSLPNWFPQLCCNKRSVCAWTSWVQLNWSRCGWLSTSTTSLLCSMLCLSLNLISTVQHSQYGGRFGYLQSEHQQETLTGSSLNLSYTKQSSSLQGIHSCLQDLFGTCSIHLSLMDIVNNITLHVRTRSLH